MPCTATAHQNDRHRVNGQRRGVIGESVDKHEGYEAGSNVEAGHHLDLREGI